ncbi:hypothetical protein GLOIN_2v1571020 [Rhizophagus clarus]|uniref:Crinkler effector protein N-terminal domain-containing protein n=1 Tax=Rhizophagus clarus TaxID=94130 RepID=A0A8H3LL28_9GLOM|nr:hypothetical protein GLOIN_2v1571020 [Rhizophagus clarus]
MESDQPKALRIKHLTALTNILPKSTSSKTSSSESSSSESSSPSENAFKVRLDGLEELALDEICFAKESKKMANIIDFRFKVHNKSDNDIFTIKITWQTLVRNAIPTIRKEMARRNIEVPNNIKLRVEDPRGPEKVLELDDRISNAMSTITLSCLVVGENPYENVFEVDIDNNKTVNRLKDAIKENQKPFFDNIAPKELKLWKVDISLKEENKKLELVNTKINVNIKEDLGGEELPPLSKISKYFPSQPADEHIHIIVQRPVETKEVHCTATYGHKSANFQWTVSREMVLLESFKKLCEYFTFPDRTENEHIVIGYVIGGAGLKRKISTGKMRRNSDLSSQSATVESDTVEILTERKVIQFSTDENLTSIIWTTNPKVDLEIVVNTLQQPFSSYTFPKMKAVFSLKADDYNGLSLFDGGVKDTPKEIQSLSTSQYEISGSHGKGPVDWVIKVGNTIITVTEAKKEDINQGIAQNAVQLQTSIQRNPKKCSYDTAGLHEDVMYGIVSTAVDWVIIKLVSSSSENNSEGKVEVLLSFLSPSPLPINNSVLTCKDLAKPVENLFGQIKWVFDS